MSWPENNTGRLKWLVLGFLTIHAGMLAYDTAHPSIVLNADRASSRLASIHGLYMAWAEGGTAKYLASHGVAGDYALQAAIIALGGQAGLIICQITLALITGFAVFRLGRHLGWSNGLSTLACAIYLILPHSLVFPHQLASEALHSPLLIMSIWLGVEFVATRSAGPLLASALMLGLATLIRPITLLWPVVVALFMARASQPKYGLGYLTVSLLPMIAWMTFVAAETGRFGMGESGHDLGHNLYKRVQLISDTLSEGETLRVRAEFLTQGKTGSLGVGEYLRFGFRYPAPFLRHAARDTLVFFAKSSIERIVVDYLDVKKESHDGTQNSRSGWRRYWEKEGILATLRHLWQSQGAILVISGVGAIAMFLLTGLAIIGAWHLLSNFSRLTTVQCFTAALLVFLPLYILVFSQVVNAMQSRHRASAEAALVLLAVLGGSKTVTRFSHPSRIQPRVKG